MVQSYTKSALVACSMCMYACRGGGGGGGGGENRWSRGGSSLANILDQPFPVIKLAYLI